MSQSDPIGSLFKWRAQVEASLRAEDGWLAVAGLFWLRVGQNRVGSAPESDIELPADAAPAYAATLSYDGSRVILHATTPAVRVNGNPVTSCELRSDVAGQPDMVQIGRLRLSLIQRGARLGVRLRDPERPERQRFSGRRWFAPDLAYCVAARFVAAPAGSTIAIINILGDSELRPHLGDALFSLDGHALRLQATSAGERAFFIFRDATAGHETYPAARFLYSPMPSGDTIELDFNQAHNPPCAFTPYATCPLPPAQNILAVRIVAGELAPVSG